MIRMTRKAYQMLDSEICTAIVYSNTKREKKIWKRSLKTRGVVRDVSINQLFTSQPNNFLMTHNSQCIINIALGI